MKRCSLFCAGWWPFLLFPVLLLCLFMLLQWRSVEENILTTAQQAITQSEQTWANAETYNRGREVLVTGFAPSDEAQRLLEQHILRGQGVHSVTFADDIADPTPLTPAQLTINWLDGKVVLNGVLQSQTNIDALISEANASFGAESVMNQLTVSESVDVMALTPGLLSSLKALDNGDQIVLTKDQITINGAVLTNAIKTDISSRVATVFTGKVNNLLSVTDNLQCESRLNELLNTTNIVFATGEATISQKSDGLLSNLADVAKDCPDAKFEVAGHTDAAGSLELNMRLSQERAQAVFDRLLELGLDGDRFDVRGYGPNQPIADNSSEAGKAQNRRIEFNLKN